MKNFLLYLLYRGFSLIVKILPETWKYYLGIGFGKLAYFLTGKRRHLAKKNLKESFPGQLSVTEISRIIKNVYSHLGLTLVEFILMDKIDKTNFRDYFKIEGEERLAEAYEGGNGVILYGAHFGNWEWLAMFISLLGYPLNAIARIQKNSYIDQVVNQFRQSKGINIIPKGVAVRKVFHCLKQGECVYILGDQDAHGKGWKMDFFGRPASTHTGPVKFAQRTGATIVPVFLVREGWRQHRLMIKEPIEVKEKISTKKQEQLLQNLNDLTTDVISEHKEQWLWLHRRWKSCSKNDDN